MTHKDIKIEQIEGLAINKAYEIFNNFDWGGTNHTAQSQIELFLPPIILGLKEAEGNRKWCILIEGGVRDSNGKIVTMPRISMCGSVCFNMINLPPANTVILEITKKPSGNYEVEEYCNNIIPGKFYGNFSAATSNPTR